MKRTLQAISLATVFSICAAVAADDLAALSGKWSAKKVNDQGQNYSQTLEIKKDKFIFKILGGDDSVVLYAEGDFKLEKIGPFNSAKFYHIKGGQSASNLEEVDDEYVSIYTLVSDTWTMASHFDNKREHQNAAVDAYKRVKTTPATKPESK